VARVSAECAFLNRRIQPTTMAFLLFFNKSAYFWSRLSIVGASAHIQHDCRHAIVFVVNRTLIFTELLQLNLF
jgi:hypothetical protein